MSKPPLHHVSAIRCSQVRNAFETPALLALDYFTNEILILGRITFFNQIDSRWHWRLSGEGSVEIVSANGTKQIVK